MSMHLSGERGGEKVGWAAVVVMSIGSSSLLLAPALFPGLSPRGDHLGCTLTPARCDDTRAEDCGDYLLLVSICRREDKKKKNPNQIKSNQKKTPKMSH